MEGRGCRTPADERRHREDAEHGENARASRPGPGRDHHEPARARQADRRNRRGRTGPAIENVGRQAGGAGIQRRPAARDLARACPRERGDACRARAGSEKYDQRAHRRRTHRHEERRTCTRRTAGRPVQTRRTPVALVPQMARELNLSSSPSRHRPGIEQEVDLYVDGKSARREDRRGPSRIALPLALREARRRWAELLRQILEVDPLACPRCGGTMRIVACITARAVIDQILTHLRIRATRCRGAAWGWRRGPTGQLPAFAGPGPRAGPWRGVRRGAILARPRLNSLSRREYS